MTHMEALMVEICDGRSDPLSVSFSCLFLSRKDNNHSHRPHGAGKRYIYIYTHNYVCVIVVIVVYIYIYICMIYLQYTLVTIKTSTMEPTENASFMSSCWRCVLTHVAPQPILLGNRWTSHTWGKLQRIP